nr:inositol-1-monophosphatase [uncultured Moellerella sp.]
MHPMLNIAIRAARKAGNYVAKSYATPESNQSTQKATNDFITNVMNESEHHLIETIKKSYPQHTIISANSGELIGDDDSVQWVINPLDGTTNFSKRLPHFAISVAVRLKGRTEVAVVYDPMHNELFSAVRGQGAQLDSRRQRVSDARELEGTIVATGFPYKMKQHALVYTKVMTKMFESCSDFRCTGVPSLNLVYVASGRVDAYFEIGLKPWEFIAGEMIMREAGGIMTDFVGDHNYINSGNVIAGTPRVVRDIIAVMRDELNEALKR